MVTNISLLVLSGTSVANGEVRMLNGGDLLVTGRLPMVSVDVILVPCVSSLVLMGIFTLVVISDVPIAVLELFS